MDDVDYDDIDFENLKNLIYDDGKIVENKKNSNINWCFTCNNDNIIEDCSLGILVCKNCGDVISTVIDADPEWSNHNENGKEATKSSLTVNTLLPQSSIATTIHGMSSRLKTIHSWSAMPYHERSLNDVFKEISMKCREGKILKCIEDDAKIMYKNINDCKIITRGSNRRSLIAACVFYACRKKDKTRSPKEIANIFGLKFTEITRGCKMFAKLAKMKNIDINFIFTKPEHFINRFCEDMKIKVEYAQQAVIIANNVEKIHIASMHTPISIASGAIFMMVMINGLNINKKDIADKFNISQVTVSKAYKKIEKFIGILDDNKICDKLHDEIIEYKNNIMIKDATITRFIRFGIYHPLMFSFIEKDKSINTNKIMEQLFELDHLIKTVDNRYINEIIMDDILYPLVF